MNFQEFNGADQGRIYVGAGGHVLPQIHLLPPPQIQKLADRCNVIFEVPKCSKNANFTELPQTV